MKNVAERIRDGEQAIARAKAEGRDTSEWEAHLAELKREAMPRARVIAEVTDPVSGEVRAVKLCSAPLETYLWVLHDPEYLPPDDDPVFFEDEFEFLKTKSIEQLREALKVKVTFPRSRVVQ
jgi:hypothetical protein